MPTIYTVITGSTLGDLIAFGFTDSNGNTVSNFNDWINAYEGADIIHAAGGSDRVFGEAGNDTIYGGDGRDRLDGGDDDDWLYGGNDGDRMWGGNGDDRLFGEHGDDALRGGSGNDLLDGGIGNDSLIGQSGNNTLLGGEGDDYLDTGNRSSTLDGGADSDTLMIQMSRGQDHVVSGGTEADQFIFVRAFFARVAEITITDFELGTDSFEVDGVDHSLYMSLVGGTAVTDQGGNALLTMTSGDTVLFEGISETELQAHYGILDVV